MRPSNSIKISIRRQRKRLTIIAVAIVLSISSLFGVFLFPSPPAHAWVIEGSKVYINDTKVYMSADPHTLTQSGFVYFNFTLKVDPHDTIDFVWGFDTTMVRPRGLSLWTNYTHTVKTTVPVEHWGSVTVYNVTSYYSIGIAHYHEYTVDYGNSNNTYLYWVNYTGTNHSSQHYIIAFSQFQNLGGGTYLLSGHYDAMEEVTTYPSFFDWLGIGDVPSVIYYDYDGFNTWYLIENASIIQGVRYCTRSFIDINPSSAGKYGWAAKPHSQTIAEAISLGNFYYLDPWWNASWARYKMITISNPSANYQMMMNVTYDSDMQADFDDLRFVDGDNTTVLPYWIENKVNSSYARVWVKLNDTGASINMYYGNNAATASSNGTNTFIFFDDFLGSTLSSARWATTDTPTCTVSGGELTFRDGTITSYIANGSYGKNTAMRFRTHQVAGYRGCGFGYGLVPLGPYLTPPYFSADTSGATVMYLFWANGTAPYEYFNYNYYSTSYYVIDFGRKTSKIIGKLDTVEKFNSTTHNPPGNIALLIGQKCQPAQDLREVFDWVLVRLFPETEAVGTFGSEQPPTWTFSSISPADASTNVTRTGDFLQVVSPSVTVNISTGTQTIKLYGNATGTWVLQKTYTGVGNGAFTFNYTTALVQGQKYWWRVNASSGSYYSEKTYNFTLATASITNTNPYPADGAIDISPVTGVGINILHNSSIGYRMHTEVRSNATGALVTYADWTSGGGPPWYFITDIDADGWDISDATDYVDHLGWQTNGTAGITFMSNNESRTQDMGMTSWGHTYYWSINTTDGDLWQNNTYSLTTLADTIPPVSSVDSISPYWKTTSPLTITATASDATSGVKNVTLYYSYSADNSSWGANTSYGVDPASPWSWSFTFPNGTGHYKFYTISKDNATNTENATIYDTLCGYDNLAPTSNLNKTWVGYWFGSIGVQFAVASDIGTSGLKNVTLYYRYSTDNISWGGWCLWQFGNSTVEWDDYIPPVYVWILKGYNGSGHYQFYTIAIDNATNIEAAPGSADAIYGWDYTTPTSSVDTITGDYWKTTTPLQINVTASDTWSGLKDTKLYYRYSTDNSSWGGWTLFGTDNDPWVTSQFSFTFGDGLGHYQFYSIATDNISHVESAPGSADTYCGFDNVTPSSSVLLVGDGDYMQTDAVFDITATVSEAGSGIDYIDLFYQYAVDNVTWGAWTSYGASYTTSWSFNNPDGHGYYRVYTRALDNASNYEAAPGSPDKIFRYVLGISISNPTPANGTMIFPAWSNWTVDISSSGTFNWSIEYHCPSGWFIRSNIYDTSGPKGGIATDVFFIDYDYDYIIYVNVTNSYGYTKNKIYHILTEQNYPVAFGTPTPANNSIDVPLSFNWTIPFTKDSREPLINYNYAIICYDSNGTYVPDWHYENGITTANHTGYIFLFGLKSNETYSLNVSVRDWYGAANFTGGDVWVNRTYYFTTANMSSYMGWWDDEWRAKKLIKFNVTEQEAEGLQVLVNISKGVYGAVDDLSIYPPRIVVNSSNLGECRFIARYLNTTTMLEEFTVLPVYLDILKEGMFIHYANEQPATAYRWQYVDYMHVWIKLPTNTGDKEYNGTAGELWVYWKNLNHFPYPGACSTYLTLIGNGSQVFNYFTDFKSTPIPGWFSSIETGDNKAVTHSSAYMGDGGGLLNTGRRIRVLQQMLTWDYYGNNHNNYQDAYLADDTAIAPDEKLGFRTAMYYGYTPPVMDKWSNISGGAPYLLGGDAHIAGGTWQYGSNKTGDDIFSDGGDVSYTWGNVAHLSAGAFWGYTEYIFSLGTTPTVNSLDIGVNFKDTGTIWHGGPNLYIYNIVTHSYDAVEIDMGEWDVYTWAWYSVSGNVSNYINTNPAPIGETPGVKIKIYASANDFWGGDETWVANVGLRHMHTGTETHISESALLGYACYNFTLVSSAVDTMRVGVYYKELGTPGWGGPDLYLYNFDTSSWGPMIQGNLGQGDHSVTPVWVTIPNPNAYVSSTGQVLVEINDPADTFFGGDSTQVTNISVNYAEAGGSVPGTGNARLSLVDTVGGVEDETTPFYMPMSDNPTSTDAYHFYDIIWYNSSTSFLNLSLNIFDYENKNLWKTGPPTSTNVKIWLFDHYGWLMDITNKPWSTHSRTYGWSAIGGINTLWVDNAAHYFASVQDEIKTSYPYFAVGKYVWRDNYSEPVVTSTLLIELPYFFSPYPNDGATDIPIDPVFHGYALGGFGGVLKTDWYLDDPPFGFVFKQENISAPSLISWASSGDCPDYKTTYTWRVVVSDSLGNTFTANYTFTTLDIMIADFNFTIIDFDSRKVQFNDTSFSTLGIDYYNWLFAHSSTSNKKNPMYTFGSSYNWSVTLTIENETSHRRSSITKYVDLTGATPHEHFLIDIDWGMFIPWMYIIVFIVMLWVTMQFFNRLWRKQR